MKPITTSVYTFRNLIEGFTATRKETAASHLADLRRAPAQGDIEHGPFCCFP